MARHLKALLVSSVVLGLAASSVEAQRRRRPPAAPAAPPASEAIGGVLGELSWGMSREAVVEHFNTLIRERHAEAIRTARDAIRADQERVRLEQELRRFADSVVEFDGQVTGYETHFLRDEFTPRNHESLVMFRDGNSENYYFFIQDKLWKYYKAFDASVFGGRSFEEFAQALQGRFGPAVERTGALVEGGERRRWLEWTDPSGRTLARALENPFYGFYSLVLTDKETLARIDELRPNRPRRRGGGHAVVDRVTGDEDAPRPNSDIVDALTGRNRNRQDAPPEKAPPRRAE